MFISTYQRVGGVRLQRTSHKNPIDTTTDPTNASPMANAIQLETRRAVGASPFAGGRCSSRSRSRKLTRERWSSGPTTLSVLQKRQRTIGAVVAARSAPHTRQRGSPLENRGARAKRKGRTV